VTTSCRASTNRADEPAPRCAATISAHSLSPKLTIRSSARVDCDPGAGRREARHANREKCIDLRSDSIPRRRPTNCRPRAVAAGDFFPRRVVAPIILFRQPRTIEKLVGHALKSRKHYDDRSPAAPPQERSWRHRIANRLWQRRTTKLKISIARNQCSRERDEIVGPPTNFVGTH